MDNDIEIKHKFEYNGNCYTIDYINASDIYNKIKEGQIEVQKKSGKNSRNCFSHKLSQEDRETIFLNTNKEGRLDEAAAIPSCLPNS